MPLSKDLAMSADELDEFMESCANMRIATFSPGGRINLTPLWYGWAGGKVYTMCRGQKVRNLRRNQAATVIVDRNELFYELQGAMLQGTAIVLEDAGAELVEIDLTEIATLWLTSNVILAVEAATFHTPYLIENYSDYGDFCKNRLLSAFAFNGEDFVKAQKIRQTIRSKWNHFLKDFDLLVTHSQPEKTPLLDKPSSTRFMNSFNILGWPAISIPMGKDKDALPLGIQLVAKPWQEEFLLRAAQTIESYS